MSAAILSGADVARHMLAMEPVSPSILEERDARLLGKAAVLELRDGEDQASDHPREVDRAIDLLDEAPGERHVVETGPELPSQVVPEGRHVVIHAPDATEEHAPGQSVPAHATTYRGGGVRAADLSRPKDSHDGGCSPELHLHRRPDPH